MSNKSTYILGPSHIHSDFTWQIYTELSKGRLFKNCILDAYRGIPIWSAHIQQSLQTNIDKLLVWIVSDYKFNNFDYPKILDCISKRELFLNTIGHPGNVDTNFMTPIHIETLGNHSLNVIDYTINKFPKVKLIFWCLYKRTKVNKNSSYPPHLWYDAIKQRYANNIIDIDKFTNPREFSNMIRDEGGHPNINGFILMDRMIKSVS